MSLLAFDCMVEGSNYGSLARGSKVKDRESGAKLYVANI